MDIAPVEKIQMGRMDAGGSDGQNDLPKNPELSRVSPSSSSSQTARIPTDSATSAAPAESLRSLANAIDESKTSTTPRLQDAPFGGINVQNSAEEIAMARAMLKPFNHRDDPLPESSTAIDQRKGASDLSLDQLQDKRMSIYKSPDEASSMKDVPKMASMHIASQRPESANEAKKPRFKRIEEKPRDGRRGRHGQPEDQEESD